MGGPAPWLAKLFHPFPKQEGIRLATIPRRDTELKERLHGARSTPLLWGLASAGITALIGSSPRQPVATQPASPQALAVPASAGSVHDGRQPGGQPRRLTAQACLCLAVLQRLLPEVGLTAAQAAMDGAEDPLQQLLYVCRSGVTACLLINCLAPDTIDERALHTDSASQPQQQAQPLPPPPDATAEAGQCSNPGPTAAHDGNNRSLTIKLSARNREPDAPIAAASGTETAEAVLTDEASAEAANPAIPERGLNQPTTAPARSTTAPLAVPVSPHSILCDDPLAGSLHPLAPDSLETLGSSPGDGVLHQDLNALSLQTDWFDAGTAGMQDDSAGQQQQRQQEAQERQQLLWNWQLAHGSALALGCSLEGMPAEALARGEAEVVVAFIMELLKFSYMQVLSPDVAPALLALCAPGETESDLACAIPLTLLTRWVEHYVPGLATPATRDSDITTSHALRSPVTPKPGAEPASLSSSSGGTTQWIHVAARDLAPGSSSPSQCESPRVDCPAPLPVAGGHNQGHASDGQADSGEEEAAGALGIHALAQLLRALQPSTPSATTPVATTARLDGCIGLDQSVGGLAEVQTETGTDEQRPNAYDMPGSPHREGGLHDEFAHAENGAADQQLESRLTVPQGEHIDERAEMLLLAGQVVAQAAALGVDLPMQGWWLLEGGAPVRLLLLLAVARAVLTPSNTSAPAQIVSNKTAMPEMPRDIMCKQASTNSVAADRDGRALAHQTLEPQQEGESRQGQEVESVQGQEIDNGQGQETAGQAQPWQEAGRQGQEAVGQGKEAGGQGQEAGSPVHAQAAAPQQDLAMQEGSVSHAGREEATPLVPDSPAPSAFAAALAAAQQSSGSAARTRSRRRQGPDASSPSPGPPGWQNMQLRHTIGPSRVGEETAAQVRDVSGLLHASRQDGGRPAAVGHRSGRAVDLLQGHGEEVDRQEERLLRSWLNSLLVDRNIRVTSLFDASMCTGWPLLVACDIMAPDCVNWARAFPPPYNGKRVPRKLMAVENGNQVCHICTHVWHLPLVNIGGVDVAEGHKGALTALVWQLMRHHMTLLLGPLVPPSPAYRLSPTPSSAGIPPLPVALPGHPALGAGAGSVHSPRAARTTPGLEPRLSASASARSQASAASSAHHPSGKGQLHQIEEEVLRWANAKLAEQAADASDMADIAREVGGGKIWRISSLNDPCLANGQVLLVLLARIRPSAINPAHVLRGATTHEKMANARMVICVARGLGAKVYMAADDLAEGRPRAVLMLLAALMACDRAIQAEK